MTVFSLITSTMLGALVAGGYVAMDPGPSVVVAASPQDSTYGCLICHADKRRSYRLGVHAEHGIQCHDCHGGDTEAVETASAHRRGFLGAPDKLQTLTLCSSCHSDPNQMRQFGLSADQLAEFRTSRHGQLLIERRDFAAPTCTDCHDAHTILPPDDARSNVHPMNIPGTCARCHADRALMATYGLPTGQLEQYRSGAHGVGLFEERNFASPTCVGCHGSHSALPPAVSQITDVCAKCHVLLNRKLAAGAHGRPVAEGAIPGCLACHGNHGTEPTPPERIVALCVRCHGQGSGPMEVAAEIQERILAAGRELDEAADAIEELVAQGYNVDDERFRHRAAMSDYTQLALVQHSLDLDELQDLVLKVRSNTGIILSTAEAHADEKWEHKLLLVPVWFLALSAMVLAWFKLREVSR